MLTRFFTIAALVATGLTQISCSSREVQVEQDDREQALQEMLEDMTPEEREQYLRESQQMDNEELDPTVAQ